MNKILKNRVAVCVFTFPALIVFTAMVFYPIFITFYRSAFKWDGIGAAKFIALKNYKNLFLDDTFYISLKNGLIFAVVLVVLQIGIGTILALAVSDNFQKGKKFLKTAYFIPVVLSVTVVCQLWLQIYDADNGLINTILTKTGLAYRQNWLTSKSAAIFAIAVVNAWQYMGYHFALLYAGIKSIPEHFYEAARIDGASRVKAHLHITLPLLAETFKFCLTIAISGGLNAYANMLIMTNGGPGTDTYTLTFMSFRAAFQTNEFGYGCAIAVTLVLESLIATLIINRFVARERITY